jgi:regulator of sirC expression with transglutaminase-like and TPR domain
MPSSATVWYHTPMPLRHPARRRFCAQIARPDALLSLADAALCIAWEDRGDGNPDLTLAKLAQIADTVRPRLEGLTHPPTIIQTLNSYLFDDLGFRGNTWSYGEPENSFLDHALQTRAGLPITLAIIYLEISWRLGLPMAGVALPGHFIVCYNASDERIYIDPFQRGRRWSQAECETQIRLFYGDLSAQLAEAVLAAPSRHAILARVLRNLKGAYIERSDFARAHAAVERVLLIEPNAAQDLRDRGLLRIRLGRDHQALEDLDAYIRMAPNPADLSLIEKHAHNLIERIGRRS